MNEQPILHGDAAAAEAMRIEDELIPAAETIEERERLARLADWYWSQA